MKRWRKALAARTKSARRGIPCRIRDTVFGKLNGYISPDGKGVRVVRSIQRCSSALPVCSDANSRTVNFPLEPVDPSRCIVIMERLRDTTSLSSTVSYVVKEDCLSLTYLYTGVHSMTLAFWIIEFY